MKIYILELEGHNWYVGKSAHMAHRVIQHFSGNGAVWTKKYPPIRLAYVCDDEEHLEYKITLEMMLLVGYDKVKGAGFTNHSKRPKGLNGLVIKHLEGVNIFN